MNDILHPSSGPLVDCWNTIGVMGEASCPKLTTYIHCRNCPAYSAAAAAFLDTELPAHYLQQSTEQVAREQPLAEADPISVVVFRIGDEWFGLPTAIVEHIVSVRRVHAIPHRRNGVLLGLANIRGVLLPCFSLQQVLGLDVTAPAAADKAAGACAVDGRLLVMQRDGSRAVCNVSEVHGIVNFFPRDKKPAPATITKATAAYTLSVLSWHEKLVGLLNDELLFKTVDRSLA